MRQALAPVAALGTVLTAGLLFGAPAAVAQSSAYPVSGFDVTYGNTYTRGTVTWYNQSFGVAGEHKSVSATSCRGTTVFALDSAGHEVGTFASEQNVCGRSATFGFTLNVHLPGSPPCGSASTTAPSSIRSPI